MKKFKRAIITGFLVLTLMFTATVANASRGNWQSKTSFDANGVSTVWTTYTGGGDDAEVVDLKVKMATGGTVGAKTVGASMNQYFEHTCWGQPLKDRYGYVKISADAYHSPGFNA